MIHQRSFALWACFFGFTGVLFGAFGAHALKDQLSREFFEIFNTATRYQLLHLVPLFFISMICPIPKSILGLAGYFFVIGVIIFSGSLYLLVMTGIPRWGAVTPVGGLLLLLGWLLLAVGILKKENKKC